MKKLGRKFNFNPRRKIHKTFDSFKVKAKSLADLNDRIAKNNSLRKVITHVFSKKTLAVATVSGAVAVGAASIMNYIESNSGCFKKNRDGSVCKVVELSCCQQDKLDNVPYCDGMTHYNTACDQFDEDVEKSCCRDCTCTKIGCDENEDMQCQRPTVADALTHFAQNVSSGIWSSIETFFPWISYVVYGFGIVLAVWLLSWIAPFIYRILPRKRNQDV